MSVIEQNIKFIRKRVEEIKEIKRVQYISNFPQWTDADLISIITLLGEYDSVRGERDSMKTTLQIMLRDITIELEDTENV